MGNITFTVNSTPENLAAIVQIVTLASALAEPVTPVVQDKPVETVVEDSPVEASSQDKPVDSAPTIADFRAVVKKAKADHGESFVTSTIEACGTKPMSTLGRTVSKVDLDQYPAIIGLLVVGPVEVAEAEDVTPVTEAEEESAAVGEIEDEFLDDLDDDLGDNEPEPEPEVDISAVKIALKAYAKSEGRDNARELMAKYKCGSLADVAELGNKDLAAILKSVV